MLENCCAFTGHRPQKFPWKYDEADSRCVALKAVLAEQIAALVNAGFTQFLSGMAEAVDTWCALSVLSLREKNPAIKLHYVRLDAERPVRGLGKPQQAAWEYRKRYSHALLAYVKAEERSSAPF